MMSYGLPAINQKSLLKFLDRAMSPALVFFLRQRKKIKPKTTSSTQHLIIRPGGMGDLVLAHLAIKLLDIQLEKTIWLIEKRSEPWAKLKNLNYFCYDRWRDWFSILKLSPSHIVNTEQLFGMPFFVVSLVRRKWTQVFCFATNRCAVLADEQVPYNPSHTHELSEFIQLFSVSFQRPPPQNLTVTRESPANSNLSVVGIAGLNIPERTLKVDQWCELIQHNCKTKEYVFVCAPNERSFAELILQKLGKTQERFFSFAETVDQISKASRLITVDGGLVHIASFLGVPTTAVFTCGNYRKWSPLSDGSQVLRTTNLDCQPCTLYGQTAPCANHFRCHNISFGAH